MRRREFLSRVSHELRTPLNAILGFGQLLEVEPLSERQHASVEQIMKGGRHLLELVDELLEISRIESGEFKVSLRPIDVAAALEDILHLLQPLAAERHVSIISAVSRVPWALADEQRTKQVLLNLLSNAIKYNRSGGGVDVASPSRHRTRGGADHGHRPRHRAGATSSASSVRSTAWAPSSLRSRAPASAWRSRS